ncbi:MAG: cupin domain-containing protein [Planctomycetota bacterium]
MNAKFDDTNDVDALAALYVAGSLTAAESAALEARLRGGDAALAKALKCLEPVVESLLSAASPAAPNARVRAQLLARVTAGDVKVAKVEGAEDASDEPFVLRAQDGQWRSAGVRGVELRELFRDQKLGRRTFMVRMQPGATFPSHPHYGPEECFVLEGDIWCDGIALRAGDYQRQETNSVHGLSRTENGCLLLFTAELE